jgi:hypothetical protein
MSSRQSKCISVFTFIAAIAVSPGSSVSADTIDLNASKDNTLIESLTGALSNGSGEFFFAGLTGQASDENNRRGLLAFDLSPIPAGSTVESATLKLHMSGTNLDAASVELHRVLANWGEGGSDAPGGEGIGAAALSGDATWLHTFLPGSTWTSAGGDFAAAASAVQSIGGEGSYEWSSAELAADVQDWIDNPSSNFGWLLLGDESTPGSTKRFDSRENPATEFRPVLTVAYVPVPEPGGAALMATAVGSLVAFGRNRRKRRYDATKSIYMMAK